MTYIALGLLLLLLGYVEPALRLASQPLGAFFIGFGVGQLLHRRGRHVWGYLATFLGVAAALYLIPLPVLTPRHREYLVVVAFGFFLNSARFFTRRLKKPLAPVSIAVSSWGLGSFLQLTHLHWLSSAVWGVGAGGAAASALGLLGGRLRRVGRFFARHTAAFGVLGGLLSVLYQVASLTGATWLFYSVAVGSVAAILLLGGDAVRPRPVRLYDDLDVAEVKRLEKRFIETGDVALLATYVAYHMARGGVDEGKALEVVRAALDYRDVTPSPFAPPLVVKLLRRLNRRRRAQHIKRVTALLERYL
ncbi:MAG: hypothetical protein ACP5J0_01360 [Pyrobaculum sp.]